jgi:hypothetical protein
MTLIDQLGDDRAKLEVVAMLVAILARRSSSTDEDGKLSATLQEG